MHRGMAAQPLLSALPLPGTGELCEQGPRGRAERTGGAWLFVTKGPKFAARLLAQRGVFKENQRLRPVARVSIPQRVPLEYPGVQLSMPEPGGFSPPGSTGRAGRLGWHD